MIDATLLFDSMTVYSPWFPRQADMLRVVAECVAVNGSTLTIELYTKNSEETGDGAPVNTGVSISLSSVGRSAATEWQTVGGQEGVQQLLRFRYTVASGGGNPNDWILFRLLPAVWYDTVAGAP
jgi:hypothetical protein